MPWVEDGVALIYTTRRMPMLASVGIRCEWATSSRVVGVQPQLKGVGSGNTMRHIFMWQ